MLVSIGSAALHGCSDDGGTRDMYRTRAECQRDWGDDPKKCEAVTSGSHSGFYYGPVYGGGRTGATSADSHAVGTTHVTRGGFGSSASAHGAGG